MSSVSAPETAAASVSFTRLVLLLGLCTALGPFAIDMYLPGLPALASDLKVDGGRAQLTIVAFFVALTVGQLVYGPLSDALGRRGPLLVGTILFVVGSIGCAVAPNLELLLVSRFLQGLGGAAGGVISRAVGRDLYTGEKMAKLFAMTLMVLGVSPIIAPVLGSAMVEYISWRSIFVFVTGVGIVTFIVAAVFLPESHSHERRHGHSMGSAFSAYGMLLRDGWFLTSTLTGGFAMGAFFAYLSSSSFVYIEYFGVSPLTYGMIFGLNAVAFIGGAQFNVMASRRFGVVPMITCATSVMLASLAMLGVFAAFDALTLTATLVCILVSNCTMGFLVPPASVLVLEPYGRNAGAASALMGTIQIALGTITTVLVSLMFDGTPRPMAFVMTLFAALSVLSWWRFITIRRRRRPDE